MVWNSPFSPQTSTPQAVISSTMARSMTRPSSCRGSTRRSSVLMRHRYPSSSTSWTFSCRSWCHRGYTASNPTFRQRSSPQARLFSMSISPKHTSSAPCSLARRSAASMDRWYSSPPVGTASSGSSSASPYSLSSAGSTASSILCRHRVLSLPQLYDRINFFPATPANVFSTEASCFGTMY